LVTLTLALALNEAKAKARTEGQGQGQGQKIWPRGQGQGLTTLVKRRAASLHQLSFLFLPENLTIPCFDKRLGLGVIKFHSLGVIGGNRAVSWVPPELSIR